MSYFDGAYNNTFVWADVEASRHDMRGPQRYMSRKKGSWQRKADGFAVAVGRLCGGKAWLEELEQCCRTYVRGRTIALWRPLDRSPGKIFSGPPILQVLWAQRAVVVDVGALSAFAGFRDSRYLA